MQHIASDWMTYRPVAERAVRRVAARYEPRHRQEIEWFGWGAYVEALACLPPDSLNAGNIRQAIEWRTSDYMQRVLYRERSFARRFRETFRRLCRDESSGVELPWLTTREREVVRLRYWEERTNDEIGERIGVSGPRVSQIMNRAFAKLRQLGRSQLADAI